MGAVAVSDYFVVRAAAVAVIEEAAASAITASSFPASVVDTIGGPFAVAKALADLLAPYSTIAEIGGSWAFQDS